MRTIAVLAIAGLLVGCSLLAGSPCTLDDAEYEHFLEHLEPYLAHLNTDKLVYEPVVIGQRIYGPSHGTCWVMLSPRSTREGYGVLHGDYSLDVEIETMTLSNLRRMVY